MAWYAELKRRKWYCINGFQAINWYRRYLYDEWYNSLTDEQKQRLEENRRKREERRKQEAQAAIQRLAFMTAAVAGLNHNNKYHGLYDDFGYPDPNFFNDK